MLWERITLLVLLVACFSQFCVGAQKSFSRSRDERSHALDGCTRFSIRRPTGNCGLLRRKRTTNSIRDKVHCFISLQYLTFWWAVKVTRSQRLSIAFSPNVPRHLVLALGHIRSCDTLLLFVLALLIAGVVAQSHAGICYRV